MKKLFAIFTAILLCLPIASCGDGDKVKVYMPDGAPAVALAEFMSSGYGGAEFTVVPASSIASQVSSGNADMAIMPVNAAATLYNGGVKITMLSVNTHGNLFILGSDENASFSDIVGHKLGVIGRGGVPDYTLRMLLDAAGIQSTESDTAVEGKIALTYANDGGELIPLFKKGDVDYALLAEPAVTKALAATGKKVAIDVQAAWRTEFGGDYPQACLVAKNSLIKNNGKFVEKFLADLKKSDGWAEQNAEKAQKAIAKHMQKGTQTSLSELAASTVVRCNIKTVPAAEAKAECEVYFQRLMLINTELGKPALGKMPDNNFYYSNET